MYFTAHELNCIYEVAFCIQTRWRGTRKYKIKIPINKLYLCPLHFEDNLKVLYTISKKGYDYELPKLLCVYFLSIISNMTQ
jgi:hypothetical protein